MTRIRTLVVDDEKPARMRLLDLLQRDPEIEVVGAARDGREAVELVRARDPHLLFLDIQMPVLDGFGVLREIGPRQLPFTIFVTAYDKYAIQAFEAHALDYLMKPFSDERFERALKRVCGFIRSQPPDGAAAQDLAARLASLLDERAGTNERSGYLERVVLKANGRVTFLDVADVDWIEASGVYVYLHVGTRSYLYRSSVANLLQRLDPRRFVRVHRSAAVNTERIRELQPRSHGDYTVILKDGTEVLMSRAYRSELEHWLRQPL
ncbi:MAG TPA: LytTR family DNA-binding domain-containing protein [Vicinamibacterales bacterium]